MEQHQVDGLVSLVRRRYPEWDGFAHAPFVADEIAYKQATIGRAREWLAEAEMRRLVAEEAYEELIGRLERLGRDNNLLWRRVTAASDLNILSQPDLDEGLFASVMLYLLYGEQPAAARIDRFTQFAESADLPNRWPFVTYFLFLCHPERELFWRPQTARWFLAYAGRPEAYSARPAGAAYAALRDAAYQLRDALLPFGPRDMVDLQSFIWVASRESEELTGGLTLKDQVELDQPPAVYESGLTADAPESVALIFQDRSAGPAYRHKEGAMKNLAEPYSRIFTDRGQAKWAFEFMREAAIALGISGPSDPRLTTNMPADTLNLNLHMGNWLILAFAGPRRNSPGRVRVPLITAHLNLERLEKSYVNDFTFARLRAHEPVVESYHFTFDFVRNLPDEVRQVYLDTLRFIEARFRNYRQSPRRSLYHIAEIAEAIFSTEAREWLLNKELSGAEPEPSRTEIGSYTLKQCSEETGLSEDRIAAWLQAIERKGQAIFYGPPGTGKTFLAEKLARHLVGGGDGFVELVQFHPAYAYEDFIQGIRPQPGPGGVLSYPLVPGRFLAFCREAQTRSGLCVLIVDEINRANLSRVFGELMYLLEYRDAAVPLAGGGALRVPANVRLLGTMNTADRSIALVDHALRRRFAFLPVAPNFEVLRRYHQATGFDTAGLIAVLERLNRQIDDPHYAVGVSYFLRPNLADELESIWRTEIEPYLEEYFFDRPERIEPFRWPAIRPEL